MVVFRHEIRHNDVIMTYFVAKTRHSTIYPQENYNFDFSQRRRCSCVNSLIVVAFKYP